MFTKLPIILGLVLLGAFSIQAQNGLSAKDINTLKGIEDTYRTSWLKNDEEKILSLFTDDATLYPNGNAPVKGNAGMREFWFPKSDTVTTIESYKTSIEDVNGNGCYATVTGRNELVWKMEDKSGAESKRYSSNNYFISVYVKRDGEWKIFKRFWSGKLEEVK